MKHEQLIVCKDMMQNGLKELEELEILFNEYSSSIPTLEMILLKSKLMVAIDAIKLSPQCPHM